MNIGKILAKVGGAIIKDVVPGAGLIIDGINAFLPDDKKLPDDATGTQAMQAVNSLPPDQQAAVLLKEMDVEIAEINCWSQVVGSLAEADKSGSSTRPQIALMMARVVCFAIVVSVSAMFISVFQQKLSIENAWPLILSIIGPALVLLRAYFGMRRDEKKARYSAATGGQVAQGGILGSLVGLFGGQR